jgi:hypothetical protein
MVDAGDSQNVLGLALLADCNILSGVTIDGSDEVEFMAV